MRFWGLAIGPTRLLAGGDDKSTAEFSGITVNFAPFASLFRLRPVAIIRPQGTIFNLIPNSKGSYWVLGATKGELAPKVDLRIRLTEPAKFHIRPSNLELTARARTTVQMFEKRAIGSLQLGFPDGGSLSLKGQGYWDRLELNAKARFNRLRLNTLDGLFHDEPSFRTRGKVEGEIQLGLKQGQVNCKGGITLVDFALRGGLLKESLSSKKTSISCRDKRFELPPSRWDYGPWTATLNGNVPLNQSSRMPLALTGLLRLKEFNSPELKIDASLPLKYDNGSIDVGELRSNLILDSFPLAHIGSTFGASIAGSFTAKGQISGPLSSLSTKLSLGLVNPQFSGLRLQEEWRGEFAGTFGSGGSLQMASVGAAVPGSLSATFRSNWGLNDLTVRRLGGRISAKELEGAYLWDVDDFRLDRVEVAIPLKKSFKRIFGEVSGRGGFVMQPLLIDGEVTLRYPRVMGLRLKEAQIKGVVSEENYQISGQLVPPDSGKVSLLAEGRMGGEVKAKLQANEINARWLIDTAYEIPKIDSIDLASNGRSIDFGELITQTFKESIDRQLEVLSQAKLSLRKNQLLNRRKRIINPDELDGKINADIELEGPSLANLKMNLKVNGYLWPNNQQGLAENVEPFVVTLKAPLRVGEGEFSVLNIPFSLLSLFAPVPSSLNGMLGLAGKYRLGKGNPDISADLILDDARLDETSLVLERGKVFLSDALLKMDLALRSAKSKESIKVVGQLPLQASSPIDLRVESHGDGLRFLDGLSDGIVNWKSGTSDFRLLIRGTLDNPIANGYWVIRNGELVVMDEVVKELDTSVIFDFNRLEVQNFDGRIATNGIVRAKGGIGLFRESTESNPLAVEMRKVPFKLPIANVEVEASLNVKGALVKPLLGGELTIKDGSIFPMRSGFGRNGSNSNSTASLIKGPEKSLSLPEQSWDFREPLDLLGQYVQSSKNNLPKTKPLKIRSVGFDNLKLRLGPNLRISSQPLANFNATGVLILNGPIDQTLRASGVVRLKNGRVNLFTTTFNLDRRAPNVAIFAPSLGLVPFLDVTMTSRVPESVRDRTNLSSSSDFATNGSSALGIGGSRFVKVVVTATGPADRLSENFELRSTPPMSRAQLYGLIGGNSLARLLGGNQSEVLANVLSKSLISPVLGTISGAFNERLQVALYPAYITSPKVTDKSADNQSTNPEQTPGQLTSQQAWVTEIGIDLTNRFNFSVLSTPNRKDIPPQGTLTYQMTPTVGVLGSLDKNGTWQSQLQVFYRF